MRRQHPFFAVKFVRDGFFLIMKLSDQISTRPLFHWFAGAGSFFIYSLELFPVRHRQIATLFHHSAPLLARFRRTTGF